ncbi:MAG: Rv3654c family TadE-like protein [Planctomycetaceae bacterium]
MSPRSERGSVSLVLVGGIAVTLVLAMGVADLARVLVVRSRARTAADAAALAAAQELAVPTGADPGSLAASYAEANGALLTACACAPGGDMADVEVRVDVGPLLLFADTQAVSARARAVVDLPSG